MTVDDDGRFRVTLEDATNVKLVQAIDLRPWGQAVYEIRFVMLGPNPHQIIPYDRLSVKLNMTFPEPISVEGP